MSKYPEKQLLAKADADGKYAGAVLVTFLNQAQVDEFCDGTEIPVTHGTDGTDQHHRFMQDEIRWDASKKEFYEYIKPADVIAAEKLAATKSELINYVQNMLDSKAREKGYDNGFACASYATSTNTTFAAEAAKYVAWRDAVWGTCYAVLAAAQAGTKYFDSWADVVPTEAELLAVLPTLTW